MFEANAGPEPADGVATTIAYALIVTPAIGTERRQDLRRELVGSWRLVSFEVRNANGSTVAYPFVEDAVGKLTYTADGNMWALARAKSSSAVLGTRGPSRSTRGAGRSTITCSTDRSPSGKAVTSRAPSSSVAAG
jgi:hypothetical protein